ncbi:MAG: thioredoxin family protein [Bacteroidia bacterium]
MRVLSTLFLVLFFGITQAQPPQIHDPVDITYSIDYLGNNEIEAVVSLEVEDGWHTYSLTQDNPMGPLATVLDIRDTTFYKKIGKPYSPSKMHKEEDAAFGIVVEYYEHEAIFKQKIKLTDNTSIIKGVFEYQVCDNEKCLPPFYEPFELKVKDGYYAASTGDESNTNSIEFGAAPAGGEGEDAIEGEMFDPISWEFLVENIGDNLIEITAKPIIQEGWHLYADLGQDIPIPTTFWLKDSLDGYKYEAQGSNELIPALEDSEKHMDELFGVEVAYVDGNRVFKQKVKLNEKIELIHGQLEYQICDDERCLPPEMVDFSVDVEEDWFVAGAGETGSKGSKETKDKEGKSDTAIFFLAFLAGLAAIFTPCMFPMIPMTVSFFTKQSTDRKTGIRNAAIFGLSIIAIFVGLGLIITLVFDSGVNDFATHPVVNIFLAIIFFVFALSFLGAFELTLPNSLINKSDAQADKGGVIGVFFMAFTTALVSFSCTAPIVGGALGLLLQGDVGIGAPLIVMFGFSSALALPFVLFALFPAWLNSLPKSGGWLNSVKVVFGLIELGLMVKFLSNADLVMQWGLITREVFIAFWIIVSIITGIYLLGKLQFSHDSPVDRISPYRGLLAILFFTFAMYLIPGMWGAPLKALSGILPPRHYVEDPNWLNTAGAATGASHATANGETVDYGDPNHCPNGLPCIKDYDEGVAIAKKLNKPILLDFTGHACANCRKMEDQVWLQPNIDKIIRNDYVLISLYVDERKKLPKEEQVTVDVFGTEKQLRTVGNKWSTKQILEYKTNSQPYYVLLSPDEEMLNEEPVGYTPDVDEYESYLKSGLEAFSKK